MKNFYSLSEQNELIAKDLYYGINNGMGKEMGEKIEMGKRGRIVIPKKLREELALKPGQILWIKRANKELLIKPTLKVEEFIAELRGCVKGSKIKPLKLKKIWGK